MFQFLRKTALWILLTPAAIWGAGLLSNQAVLIANHDQFPVMWNSYKVASYVLKIEKTIETSKDKDAVLQAQFDLEALKDGGYLDDTHTVMSSETHLNFLGDWIDLREATYSPGDELLYLGGWLANFAPFVWGWEVIGRLRKKE
jgi:hypothetical protein